MARTRARIAASPARGGVSYSSIHCWYPLLSAGVCRAASSRSEDTSPGPGPRSARHSRAGPKPCVRSSRSTASTWPISRTTKRSGSPSGPIRRPDRTPQPMPSCAGDSGSRTSAARACGGSAISRAPSPSRTRSDRRLAAGGCGICTSAQPVGACPSTGCSGAVSANPSGALGRSTRPGRSSGRSRDLSDARSGGCRRLALPPCTTAGGVNAAVTRSARRSARPCAR